MSNFQPGFQEAGRAAEVTHVPLDVQMGVQEELLSSLARAIGTLETRLGPVLTPVNDGASAVGAALPNSKCCLGSLVARNNAVISELTAVLINITSRVDITVP